MKKQVGAFDEHARILDDLALGWKHDRNVELEKGEREATVAGYRLAARLLRVAGRAHVVEYGIGPLTLLGFDENRDFENRIARLIHRAQKLAGKGEGK